MEEILLSDHFLLYPTKISARVHLTYSSITFTELKKKNSQEEKISLADVVGCQVLKGNSTTHAKWYLCIFSYPFNKKVLKGDVRCRSVRSFGVISSRISEENKQCAYRWKTIIKHLIAGNKVSSEEVTSINEPTPRNYIVYINPFGGQGKAMEIYNKKVQPIFSEAEIRHTVVKTEFAGHAKKMVKELQLEEYDGIVIVSGDGLIHEVINGLMERPDWDLAIKTPIGVVPGGSGNALAAAIVYSSTGVIHSKDLIQDSLFEIVRGRSRDLSLYYAQTQEKSFYSFLNFGWGFVADVDIESERYRVLGNARFTVGCLIRLANMRRYHGMISFLPAENHRLKEMNYVQQDFIIPDNPQNKHRSNSLLDKASPSILTPSSRYEEAGTSFGTTGNSIRKEMREAKNGLTPNQTSEISSTAPVISLETDVTSTTSSNLAAKQFHLLNSLSDSLPEDWKSVEDEFVFITPTCLSHIGQDMFMMPCAKLDEDVMYIYCVKSTVSKATFLQILLSISKGTHLALSPQDTLVIPCRAFRLEPFNSHTGYMTVDGELFSQQTFQATVTNIKAKVLCSVPTDSVS